jgi:hypothetical protein
MIDRVIRWLLPLAALAVWAREVFGLYPRLATVSQGGTPFDLRVMGYRLNDALAYAAQLTPEGLAFYLGPLRMADTLLPLLLVPVLLLPLRGRGQLWFLPALIYGLADLGENIAVARLLRAGTEMQASDVMIASTLTQGKFLSLAVAALLAVWSLWRVWRER